MDPAPDFTIRRGLWYAMVIRFCKCFGQSKGRFPLDAEDVYRGDPAALDNYKYFKHLRNKNLVHDENAMWQAFTLAVLNPRGQHPKVVDVLGFGVLGETFCKNDLIKLEPLVRRAVRWVDDEFEDAAAILKADLEKLPYEDLEAFEARPLYFLVDEGDMTSPKPRI